MIVTRLALPREVPQAFSDNDLCRLPTPYWLDAMPRVSGAVTNAPTALTCPTATGALHRRLHRKPAIAIIRRRRCARTPKGGCKLQHDVAVNLLRIVAGMQQFGTRVEVVELNHVSAGITGTYQRDSMLDERRAAMQRWSAHVAGLVSGKATNVVPLPRKGKGA